MKDRKVITLEIQCSADNIHCGVCDYQNRFGPNPHCDLFDKCLIKAPDGNLKRDPICHECEDGAVSIVGPVKPPNEVHGLKNVTIDYVKGTIQGELE